MKAFKANFMIAKMDQNLLKNFDESIKSKYVNKLYRSCYEMNEDASCEIKMSTCLNLRPKNNFQILENLVEHEKTKKTKTSEKYARRNNDTSIEVKDYKKLLVLKQKLQNSFRSKNNSKNNKSVLIDLKVPVISSSLIKTSSSPPASIAASTTKSAAESVYEKVNERVYERVNKRGNGEKLAKHHQQVRNGSILLNSKYLKKKLQLKQQEKEKEQEKEQEQEQEREQEQKDEQTKHNSNKFNQHINQHHPDANVDQHLEESQTLSAKNTFNSSKNVYGVDGVDGDYDFGDEEEEANQSEINSTDSDESSTKQTNNSYDLDCLKSICDSNKIYLKKLYNNFDIPILYCDSENQFKTEFIDENDELKELEEQDRPLLKMNPIQFNYKNIRQPRSMAQQNQQQQQQQQQQQNHHQGNRAKKPHWVNIATVGKLNDIRRPMHIAQSRRITSHLIAQKPEPSLIFVSTFSSLSTLSEYLKNKRADQNQHQSQHQSQYQSQDQSQDQIQERNQTAKKSLSKIHSEEVYSDCHRLKSKSAVVSPTSYYSVNNAEISDDENQHKHSYKLSDSDLHQYKLPDLMTAAPKLYVLNKNSINSMQAHKQSKQSFITQTQVYKKLSELQRQNTFEYLKFVSVKNLKDQNEATAAVKSNSTTSRFVAPKISKKILLSETQAENIERQKQKNATKNLKLNKKKHRSAEAPETDATTNKSINESNAVCTSDADDDVDDADDDDMEADECKMTQEEEHYEEDDDDDEDQEPDFVITQNSKSDQINEQEMGEDLEPRLNKSQPLYTHVLTSSSQLREFYQYSSATNSSKNLNLILRNSFSNVRFKDAWEFMYNERKVRKLHQKVVENLEKQRSSSDIRLVNFISSNLNYNNRSNFDCYKFYERSKTSNLLQNLRHKLFEQVTLANRLNRDSAQFNAQFNSQYNNSDLLEKSINLENSDLL